MRLNEAGYGWETVTAGSQLGSQLGYPATPRTCRNAARADRRTAVADGISCCSGTSIRQGLIRSASGQPPRWPRSPRVPANLLEREGGSRYGIHAHGTDSAGAGIPQASGVM